MTDFQTMLAMMQKFPIRMGAVEGALEETVLELASESARSADQAESDEFQREAETLEELRQALESARLELEGIADIQLEPEEAEAV